MAEQSITKPHNRRPVSLPIRLTTGSQNHQPALSDYTFASVAQGLAYVDFGFVEPSLMGAMHQSVHQGKALPKHLEATLTTRVVLPLETLLRFQQQLAKVVMGLQRKPTAQS